MKHRLFFPLLIFLVLAGQGCANYPAQQQRKAERVMRKEQKAREKAYRKMKKQHFEMQYPEVQQRMEESEKRYKRYQRERNRRSFREWLFGPR